MGKMDYLDALKRAMLGLPPEVQARTLAWYEQRFVDGEAAGRPEHEVGAELEDPNQVALALRTDAHLKSLAPAGTKSFTIQSGDGARHPLNALRMLVSGAGLAVFNLFMIVPAIVYSALLFAVYVCALTFYLAGIATTASGLAGTNELVLDWPSRWVDLADDDGAPRQLRVDIGEHGINVHPERAPAADAGDDSADAGQHQDQARPQRRGHSRLLRGADALADGTVRISTGMDAGSRSVQILVGFGMVLGGIGLCLLALTITRYTLVGLKRYLQMNWSLLRGNGA